MSLSEPVAVVIAAVVTGVLTGGPAVVIRRRRPALRVPRRTDAAWQKQVKELDELLRQQYERQIADRDTQRREDAATIADLRRQLSQPRRSRGDTDA